MIEVGLIGQAAQVKIQHPLFSTERVQVGKIAQPILLFDRIIAASAKMSNRPGGTLISVAKTAQ